MLLSVLTQTKPTGTLPGNPAAELIEQVSNLDEVCGQNPTWTCEKVYDWTGSKGWAGFAEWFVAKPLTILLIILIAIVANRIARVVIKRSMRRMLNPVPHRAKSLIKKATPSVLLATDEHSIRGEARLHTLTAVFRSLATIVIWFFAIVAILTVLHIDLAPLIASAGVIGIALGFGAQNVVRDFLAGVFLVMEDQFGVGDIVDLGGDIKGTVEGVSLRATRVRDVNGTLWHIPNGQIQRVANKSQEWSRAVLDLEVDGGTDYDQASAIIEQVAEGLAAEPNWVADIIDAPEVWGIESFTTTTYTIRLVIKTRPASQFGVMRELRIRLKKAFDDAGIQFAKGGRNDVYLFDGSVESTLDDRKAATHAAEPVTTERSLAGSPSSGTQEEQSPPADHPRRGDPSGSG